MAKISKKAKTETSLASSISKEALQEYVQDISQKASIPEDSRLHCAIAINQILSNAEYVNLLTEESKATLKEVWHKLKADGIQLVDPPLLFGLPENFDQEELAN